MRRTIVKSLQQQVGRRQDGSTTLSSVAVALCDHLLGIKDELKKAEAKADAESERRKEQIRYLGQGVQKQSEAIKKLAENVELLEGVTLDVRSFMLLGFRCLLIVIISTVLLSSLWCCGDVWMMPGSLWWKLSCCSLRQAFRETMSWIDTTLPPVRLTGGNSKIVFTSSL